MILYRAMGNPVVTLGSGLPEENFPGYSRSGDLEAGETLNPPSGGLSCPLLHFSEQKKRRLDALTLKDTDLMHRERDLKICHHLTSG